MDEFGEFNFDGEDGPGFPVNANQAAAMRRAAFNKPRKDPKLTGLWGHIARAVREKPTNRRLLIIRFRVDGESSKKAKDRIGTAIHKMIAVRYLRADGGVLSLTLKAISELQDRDRDL